MFGLSSDQSSGAFDRYANYSICYSAFLKAWCGRDLDNQRGHEDSRESIGCSVFAQVVCGFNPDYRPPGYLPPPAPIRGIDPPMDEINSDEFLAFEKKGKKKIRTGLSLAQRAARPMLIKRFERQRDKQDRCAKCHGRNRQPGENLPHPGI